MDRIEELESALDIISAQNDDFRVDDVRRLTGPGMMWGHPGAVMDVFFDNLPAAQVTELWGHHARRVLDALGWRMTEYLVTDQRVFRTGGVLVRTSVETPLDRINDFYLAQSWLGRVLDYGDLAVLTGSQEAGNLLRRTADPLGLRRTIQAASEARLSPGGDSASPQARRQRSVRDVQVALKELARSDEARQELQAILRSDEDFGQKPAVQALLQALQRNAR